MNEANWNKDNWRDLARMYFLQKPDSKKQSVGVEVEKIAFSSLDGQRIPYDGTTATVSSLLNFYRDQRGGEFVYDGPHPIGIVGSWGEISLEAGGQIEWASCPTQTLAALNSELQRHIATLRDAGQQLGIQWVNTSVDFSTSDNDVPWMPKTRYQIMRQFFSNKGRFANAVMLRTASVHCSYDYDNEGDWCKKFRTAAMLTPIAIAIFSNSPTDDGKYKAYRQVLWNEMDRDRCLVPQVVFSEDFGIEEWIEWVVDVPMIFRRTAGGISNAGNRTFRQLVERENERCITEADWELHLGTILTYVRSFRYIEIRSLDLVADGLIMSAPAFWFGILYDAQSLGEAAEIASEYTCQKWHAALDDAGHFGCGRGLRDHARRLLQISIQGLERWRSNCPDDGEVAMSSLGRLCRHRGFEDLLSV